MTPYPFVKPNYFLRKYIGLVTTAFLVSCFLATVTTLLTLLSGPVLSSFFEGKDSVNLIQSTSFLQNFFSEGSLPLLTSFPVNKLFGLLFAVASLRLVLNIIQWFLWEYFGEKSLKDLRQHFYSGILSLFKPVEIKNIDLQQLFGSDLKLFRDYLIRYYGGIPREALVVFFLGISLFILSPLLTSIVFGVCVPSIILLRIYGRKFSKKVSSMLEDQSLLSHHISVRLFGIETIKHYQTEDLEKKLFKTVNENYFKSSKRALKTKAKISPVFEAFVGLSICIFLAVAFRLIQNGSLSSAEILSFLATLIMFSQSSSKLIHYYKIKKQAGSAITRIQSYFTEIKKQNDLLSLSKKLETSASNNTGKLSCSNFTTYHHKENPLFKPLSTTFQSGQITLIKGDSGKGKTTFLRTVTGEHPFFQGELTLNTPKEILVETNKPNVGYIPQNPTCITGSVFENVIYPTKDGSRKRVEESLKKAGLLEKIESLHEGLDSLLSFDSPNFSGGELQRLHFARLFYHKPFLMILDEATSGMDDHLQSKILNELKEVCQDEEKICIMTAHKESAKEFADSTVELI